MTTEAHNAAIKAKRARLTAELHVWTQSEHRLRAVCGEAQAHYHKYKGHLLDVTEQRKATERALAQLGKAQRRAG